MTGSAGYLVGLLRTHREDVPCFCGTVFYPPPLVIATPLSKLKLQRA